MARYSKTIVRDLRLRRSCRPTSFAKIFFSSALATVTVGAWFIWWNKNQVQKGRTAFPAFVQALPVTRNSVTLPGGRPGQPVLPPGPINLQVEV